VQQGGAALNGGLAVITQTGEISGQNGGRYLDQGTRLL